MLSVCWIIKDSRSICTRWAQGPLIRVVLREIKQEGFCVGRNQCPAKTWPVRNANVRHALSLWIPFANRHAGIVYNLAYEAAPMFWFSRSYLGPTRLLQKHISAWIKNPWDYEHINADVSSSISPTNNCVYVHPVPLIAAKFKCTAGDGGQHSLGIDCSCK